MVMIIICGEINHPTTSGEWKQGVDPHTPIFLVWIFYRWGVKGQNPKMIKNRLKFIKNMVKLKFDFFFF